MRKYILGAVMALVGLTATAQKEKYVSDTLKVYGNCEMCEERIENACDIVGVKRADWDQESKLLKVVYRPDKVSLEEIHQLCANAGHATSKLKADHEAYEALHHCCKYVVHEHEGEEHEH